MKDDSSEGSSDEFYSSYKSQAKRVYRTALKRSAEVKLTTVPASAVSISSDSDENHTKNLPVKPVKDKKIERPKRKQRRAMGRGKRKKLVDDCDEEETNSPQVCSYTISSESDSSVGLDVVSQLPTSTITTRTSKRIVNQNNSSQVVIDSDLDTEPGSEKSESSQEVVICSDLDVEPTSPIEKDTGKVDRIDNELMSIKISWKLDPIQKFSLRRHQKFKTLIEHFSKLEGVPPEQIVIYGGKDGCRLIEAYDTPDTIGITVIDVLEGGVLADRNMKQSSITKRYRDPSQADGDEIEIRVQQEKTRSFPVLIKRHQKMQVLFIKVAEQLEMDFKDVKLFLDGESISQNSTPQDLDLEDGDVLDML